MLDREYRVPATIREISLKTARMHVPGTRAWTTATSDPCRSPLSGGKSPKEAAAAADVHRTDWAADFWELASPSMDASDWSENERPLHGLVSRGSLHTLGRGLDRSDGHAPSPRRNATLSRRNARVAEGTRPGEARAPTAANDVRRGRPAEEGRLVVRLRYGCSRTSAVIVAYKAGNARRDCQHFSLILCGRRCAAGELREL